MTEPKNLMLRLRRRLNIDLDAFPRNIHTCAFRMAISLFAKSRFSSHVSFLSTCLREKLIPVGFHISNNLNLQHLKPDLISRNLNQCSHRLMRVTLESNLRCVSFHHKQLEQLRRELTDLCSGDQLRHIRHLIHIYNREYFASLTSNKKRKLEKLRPIANRANRVPLDDEKLVVTIPPDLPLTKDETSVLKRGLSFIPTSERVDEFEIRSDFENFARRLRLKAHFHHDSDEENTDQPSDDSDQPLHEPDPFDALKKRKSLWTPQEGWLGGVDGQGIRGTYITSVVSPEFPWPYPSDLQRQWQIETDHDQMIIIFINYLDIEHPWDTLTLTHAAAHDTNLTRISLTSGNLMSLRLPGGLTTISFCSDLVQDRGGFSLDVRFFDTNETNYLIDDGFECESGIEIIRKEARCDGGVDCNDFSDEIGCGACGPESYQCRGSDICVLPSRQCDGWKDCPLSDDEEHCDILKCPEGYSCGESPYNDRHGPIPSACSYPDWVPFWVNGSRDWIGQPLQNVAQKATVLNLNGFPVKDLNQSMFDEIRNLHTLDISSCQLERFQSGVFNKLSRLWKIVATNNSLAYLENGTFSGLVNLRLLYLDFNQITRLDEGCFTDLGRLFFIDLGDNQLSEIRPGAFKDCTSMERLVLPKNNISIVNGSIFEGIKNHLKIVTFRDNPLYSIAPGTFVDLTKLEDLHIMSTTTTRIQLYPEIFNGLENLLALVVYDSRFCCIAPDSVSCVKRLPSHPLFTCRKTFLQNLIIKIFIWILGISALLGNGFVILTRLRRKATSSAGSIQSIFITNLAFSDFLMGAYMIILATMDLYIGDSYFWEGRAEEWRSSNICQSAGFIAFLSSEASVLLLTLLTLDRFICILFPFSEYRISVSKARIITIFIWFISSILGLISILLNYLNPDAYSLSDVCVGLPLIRKSVDLYAELDENTQSRYGVATFNTVASSTVSTWQFSIVVFLGINFISFIIILFSYITIFIKVRFSREQVGRKEKAASEIKMALKLSLIVGTDFFCWMPIIILGILIQANVISISSNAYAWLVVFILPINSSINPYLYTIMNEVATKSRPDTTK